MEPLAELTMNPGGIIAWIGVGLIAGWLAGLAIDGGGYGILADIALGLIGALIGGIVSGFFIAGDAGFWASLVIAFFGACILIAMARLIVPSGKARPQ